MDNPHENILVDHHVFTDISAKNQQWPHLYAQNEKIQMWQKYTFVIRFLFCLFDKRNALI